MRRSAFVASLLLLFAILIFSEDASAWGRRGHALIGVTAATLLAEKSPLETRTIVRERSYDLGYYANVPDICWKKPESNKLESKEHYIDLEIFDREVKGMSVEEAFALDRSEFEKKFPGVLDRAGKSMWRIRELMGRLEKISAELKQADLERDKKHELQGEWLVVAGVIGHYIGDLGMPLHVSENHDGQLTGQKGIHGFYEEVIVDTFKTGELEAEVYKRAVSLKRDYKNKSVRDVVYSLARESATRIPELLKTDKRVGRKEFARAREAYRKLIVDGMASSSVALAELWSRNLDWVYDGAKFYNFTPYPIHIVPGADPAVK